MKILRRFGFVVLYTLLCLNGGFCQSLYPPKVQSPNAASLGKFGEVPMNLFLGLPQISVPLYTVTYGNVNVPLSLRYNPASVRPGQQPGWVGSGWDLESIGAISRQVRGIIDEEYSGDGNDANIRAYYPYPSSSSQANANNFGSYLANIYPWNKPSQLAYDFFPSDCQGVDVEADEFSFNFLGHAGKFYYSGTSKGWQVVSEENIKIEMTDFYSPLDIAKAIRGYNLSYGISGLLPMPRQSRAFGGFTITVPDGTKFIFGGRDGLNVPDAVEFYCETGNTTAPNYSSNPLFVANTWLLRSIVDVYGNQVNFYYVRKYPTCNKSYGASYYSVLIAGGSCNVTETGGAIFDKNKLSGIFQWPMYLSSITTPNESVNFTMSEHSFNRYTPAQLSYVDLAKTSSPTVDNSLLGFTWPDMLNNFQWEKLDKIVITDNMHNSNGMNNYRPNVIRQFLFNYLNTSTNTNQRLMLGSLNILDNQGVTVSQYQFGYNGDFSSKNSALVNASRPIYADGNFSDHWGYYNGVDLPATATDFQLYRGAQPNVVTTELLNKVTYPTGGYTQFTWESNDYTQIVGINRQSLNASSGYGGGSRIAEIRHVLADGTIALDKKYYYKTGYAANANVNALPSSGVLNGTPVYHFSFYDRRGAYSSLAFSGTQTSMIGTGNYGYNGQGAPVGYKEVDEVNPDGSYTKNLFTSYDADLNGVSHWDIAPSGYLGYDPNQDSYYQWSSLDIERGKPTGIFLYKPDNTLLQKTIYAYRTDPQRFSVNPINLVDNSSYYRSYQLAVVPDGGGGHVFGTLECSIDGIVFASARQVYTYSYYPWSKTVTTYDQSGNNPLFQTTNFSYNSNNLLSSKTEISSKSETVVTNYSYPPDYPSDPVLQAMVAAHILTPVVKETVLKNNNPIRASEVHYFQPYAGIFVPQSIAIKVGNNANESREQINQYDNKGHILEIQRTNDVKEVYVWGCNSQYVLARIAGSDYNTARALVNQAMLDQAGVGYNAYTDADIRNELNKLRTGLPNALVTTYTYKSGVGLSSETDPRGNTKNFVYDALGRLSIIVDKDNNVLKKFCYNYAGQPENCTSAVFSNDQQQSTFTKAGCGTGTIAPTYTYIVSAGIYTSFLSKDVANQSAINAMKQNGQAAADALTCLAPLTGTNFTTVPWNIKVTKTDGSFNQTYTQNPGSAATVLGNVPVGSYDITISPVYSVPTTQLIFNGLMYSGTSFTLKNILLSAATSFTLQPASGSCSFAMSSGYSSPTNSITSNGTNVSFYVAMSSTNLMSAGNSYLVATINGGCRPSATRTMTYSSAGRNWSITIYPGGQMYWQLGAGSPSLNPNTTITTTTLTYPL